MSPLIKMADGEANSNASHSSPLNNAEASSIISQLGSATHRSDLDRCREVAARVKDLATVSVTNRSRLESSGAAYVLAAVFRTFANHSGASLNFLSEILAALVLVYLTDDEEVFCEIGSPESLDAIVSILKSGDSTGKLNAVLVLRQIVFFDGDLARAAARIDGVIETLLKLISDPISPRGKKAAQLAAFHLASSSEEWMAARFVRMGVVSLVLESLVDSESEKRVSEAALSALDRLCGCELGREKAYGNALTVPVLAKKFFGVSDLATGLVVSSLWKLCKNWEGREKEEGREGGWVVEALQFGIFMKLLMLVQMERREEVKERATELLRFLNDYEKGLGCIDSKDFTGLRRRKNRVPNAPLVTPNCQNLDSVPNAPLVTPNGQNPFKLVIQMPTGCLAAKCQRRGKARTRGAKCQRRGKARTRDAKCQNIVPNAPLVTPNRQNPFELVIQMPTGCLAALPRNCVPSSKLYFCFGIIPFIFFLIASALFSIKRILIR